MVTKSLAVLSLFMQSSVSDAPSSAAAAPSVAAPRFEPGLELEADTSSEGFHLAVGNFNVCFS
jgi:hypothetical protein